MKKDVIRRYLKYFFCGNDFFCSIWQERESFEGRGEVVNTPISCFFEIKCLKKPREKRKNKFKNVGIGSVQYNHTPRQALH